MGLVEEIHEQPGISRRLLLELPFDVAPLVAAVKRRRVRFALIAARGTSDHAGIYAQYALGGLARLPVGLATPSLVSRYETPPRVDRALVIGISQSGRSPDVVAVLEDAQRQGAVTAAITNDPDSPLAAAASHVLWLRTGPEHSIAATKTYSAELLSVALLAAHLSDDADALRKALDRLPEAQEAALLVEDQVAALADHYAGMDECVVLGRGYNLATAFEWALKLKELAYVHAQAYSTADFQHGPVASLGQGGHVLAVLAQGPLAEDLAQLLRQLRRDRHARVLALAEDVLEGVDRLPFPDRLPEWLSPLVGILPAQLFAAGLAAAKGHDTERPRGLQKVTLTR